MTRTALAALLALCVLAPVLAGKGTRESTEDADQPPEELPKNAVPFIPGRISTPKTPLEAKDMKDNPNNDTEAVHHPNVKDPGTTHAEGSEVGRGSIHACTLPSFHDGEPSASDWLADSGNVTQVCHLPVEWLNGTSGTLRVCSIPRDAWNSSYTFNDGTIPKEVLTELINTTNVKCVTPSEALSNNSAVANDTIINGSIPSAWLRDSNDNIYIYIIPQEWLRASKQVSGNASEVEDLTKDPVDVSTPTPAPTAPSSIAPAAAASTAATPTVTSNITAISKSDVVNASEQHILPNSNSSSTEDTSSNNVTVAIPTVAPADSNATQVSTIAPAVVSKDAVTTQGPKEVTPKSTEKAKKQTAKPFDETTQTTPKPKQEASKATEKPIVAIVTTAATQKPEEKVTKKTKETTQKPKEAEKSEEHHADAENEIAHGVASPPPPAALSQQNSDHNRAASSGRTAFLQPTESAAILAGVFVAIALLGYAGLLLWRRVLEKRYGNREMLVNEDDDFDTSDMRHFEL